MTRALGAATTAATRIRDHAGARAPTTAPRAVLDAAAPRSAAEVVTDPGVTGRSGASARGVGTNAPPAPGGAQHPTGGAATNGAMVPRGAHPDRGPQQGDRPGVTTSADHGAVAAANARRTTGPIADPRGPAGHGRKAPRAKAAATGVAQAAANAHPASTGRIAHHAPRAVQRRALSAIATTAGQRPAAEDHPGTAVAAGDGTSGTVTTAARR